jgi:hypothetical protein
MRCLAHSIESLIRETESNLGSESGLATGGAGHVLQPSTNVRAGSSTRLTKSDLRREVASIQNHVRCASSGAACWP